MGKSVVVPTVVSGKEKAPNWIKVTDQAGWRPRDSQGEVVFKNRMWILGGWQGNYNPTLRDVWSSADGKSWKLIKKTAPWKHSDLPMTMVFQDKIWIMGGWYNGLRVGRSASNQVWCSSDAVQWQQATKSAGWTPRLAAGAVVFNDKMWILGGIENFFFGDEKSVKNDVWCSTDGKQWELATENAGWTPRAFHQTFVFDDKIWVVGGGNFRPKQHVFKDIWCSGDGVNWTQVTGEAAWPARLWFSTAVYRNRIWVIGGWPESSTPRKPVNLADVWYSKDGKNWNELKSEVIWKPRHASSIFVFQDKIWIAGGCTGAGPRPLDSQVWSLYVPEKWFQIRDAIAP